jgi:uncharacterized protein (TIGR03435 family)
MHRVAVFLLAAAPLLAQGPSKVPPDLRFDVASLKPSPPGGRGGGIRPAAGGQRYEAVNCTIKTMIMVANAIKADQIVGGPDWLASDLYDMEAKAEKASNGDELHVMLMNMLVDRLNLKIHREKKEMRMYALTVGKDGPKMTPHEADSAGDPWIDQTQIKFLHMQMKATAVRMDYVAFRLGMLMDLPVVDLSGLPGSFDFKLEYTRDLPPGFPEGGKVNGEDPDTSGPTIFEALRKQLGLELKAQRGPVDVIVIDHAERPTAN